MHLEVAEFLLSPPVQALGWADATVIEVGAQDVNGKSRDFFRGWSMWEGVDLTDGPGVTYVGDALELLPQLAGDGRRYSHAVTTEVLEHSPRWPEIVTGMMDLLHPKGHLVITCASPERRPHGMNGAGLPEPDEHYEGVSMGDLETVVQGHGGRIKRGRILPVPGDLQVIVQT